MINTISKFNEMKLSESLIKVIAGYIEQGDSLASAAQKAGVDRSTAVKWRRSGEKAETGIHRQFYEATLEARKRYEQGLLDQMHAIAQKGERLTKIRETTSPDGSITKTREISEGNKFSATKWLLENRVGFNGSIIRREEKAINLILRIAEQTLEKEDYLELLDAVLNDETILETYELDTKALMPDDE